MAMTSLKSRLPALIALLLLGACAADGGAGRGAVAAGAKLADAGAAAEDALPPKDPYPSRYRPAAHAPFAIRNVTIWDGRGHEWKNGAILVRDHRIVAVGPESEVAIPEGVEVIDGAGGHVTPGIIDVHSHLGVYPSPSLQATSDGNEITDPNTAEVWAEHSVWPQDPGFIRALAGGVTTLQILPGSANLFGGRSVVLKNVRARTVQEMKFPGAPYGLKMACGENPKRLYGSKGRKPSTRMGNFAGYRTAWIAAQDYRRQWAEYLKKREKGERAKPPKRDLELETLAGVLDGEILVHMHCYRADEMAQVLDMAREFGYRVSTFHHAVEAYKIADLLAENGVCAAMWADWWGFKLEAYDGIRENVPFVHKAGGCAIVHSDSAVGIQRLNQEAAKAWADGRRAGVDIPKAEAWVWLSYNPARSLGIADVTGSLEPGKAADLVLWNGDPFSVYTKAVQVYIDGVKQWDLLDPAFQPVSDFELGQPGEGDAK
ncbi:MAG: imidazolonepropionase related amidohydrolase [Rhodothalassiaceae bacterium]|nr:MAG: imidazolonepropionase related amidohydrolase [Rhodothalassiaceae bacterium]